MTEKHLHDDKLPAFHVTGGAGWINDPNGLVYYKGEYHVFFQYHPYGTAWGPMHWGHVVSKDLTEWNYLPIALTPGGVGDKDGCFSGTAIVAFGKLFLMYTGFEENGGGENVRQVQCLAESEDGINFKKHGVVIGSEELPADFMPCDFRDPHVFSHGGKFYCLVAAKKKGGRGRLLLYRSDDLFKWSFVLFRRARFRQRRNNVRVPELRRAARAFSRQRSTLAAERRRLSERPLYALFSRRDGLF